MSSFALPLRISRHVKGLEGNKTHCLSLCRSLSSYCPRWSSFTTCISSHLFLNFSSKSLMYCSCFCTSFFHSSVAMASTSNEKNGISETLNRQTNEQVNELMNERKDEWMNGWVNSDRMSEERIRKKNNAEWVKEHMNHWTNEWMNLQKEEQRKEPMNERTKKKQTN